MCDYSLEHLASRPARVGDTLVTTKFRQSLTGGFCAIDEPNVAVCLQPGTELAFEREIEAPSGFWMRPKKLGAQCRALSAGKRRVPDDASRRARTAGREGCPVDSVARGSARDGDPVASGRAPSKCPLRAR
jgi:hypothetical protein